MVFAGGSHCYKAWVIRLDDEVIITGPTQGIGLAAARLCRSAGARVVLLDHDEPTLAAFGDEKDADGH
ncbi:SDR family NAD(P)-dependent oxidoreductase [Caballeronia sp. GACF4]|uniref:SDR family NAD(P)-dependent oxidoreductase n=1 Tax=Caballeronia sp. GACF4 TaxID=2921763 RepID=UPI0020288F47